MALWAAAVFIHPLVSGDWSSLDPKEEKLLEEFIQKHPKILWEAYIKEGEYRECNISGYICDCYRLIRIPMIVSRKA